MEPNQHRVPLEVEELVPPGSPVVAPPDLAPEPPPAAPAGPIDISDLREKIVEVLRTCFDPEVPVNIYEMGLIYGIDVEENGAVTVRMTLTSPACPVAGSLPPEVQGKIQRIPGVSSARVEIVWDPPWTPERMSEAARVQLGLF
jgi:FeS assembly SUF system protein